MNPVLVGGLGAAGGVVLLGVVIQGVEPLLSDIRFRSRSRSEAAETSSPWVGARAWPLVRAGSVVLRRVGCGEGRRRRRADRDLAPLLDQITRHLRAGASLPGAVQVAAAGRADPSTARLATDLAAGVALTLAVHDWQEASATPARDLAAAALILAADAGGSVAAVLDGVSDTLRDRVALEREVAALSSQARASAAVLVVAPIVFGVLAAMADPRVAQMLFGQPVGWACLAGGAVLDALGALWMSRLVAGSR